ncbi:sugar transferase [Aerococcus sp. NPDC058936]|uniref:sugar transferase n=1 Tax=Aerococcus sp. NPDC058936 TaxID=3346674 RepID=UPI0036700768
MNYNSVYTRYIKRFLDILISLVAIIVLSPVLIIVAILVRIKLGSPILFRQQRPGMNEKVFDMMKFRSMTDETDAEGNLLPDDVRLTTFGKKLRATSLDELPELFNILKGDMSLIGPRPLLVKYLPLYNDEQSKRHLVRPGLTGFAQVNGRNAQTWKQRFAYDVEYVEKVSFVFDIAVLFRTVITVLRREGVSEEGMATKESFKGNK